jgi:C-terminal processing protease CtpA/Prc
MSNLSRRLMFLLALLIGGLLPVSAQADFPPAPIVNDEGGTRAITGTLTYTNPFFTGGVAYPIIILEDQAGFVDRNESYLFPPESQTLGQLTSDFYESPVTYSLALPIEPQGSLRDVDQDGQEDTGVMVFAVAYWNNIWGDPFLEERDQQGGGWSTAYASTHVSDNPERLREIVGGIYIVFAPDDQQGFPSGFGADGLLFTADDPIVHLPQGYTLVNLDTDPFTFDRSAHPFVPLLEPEGAALVDFSALRYTDAFDAMIDLLRKEYAFTEYKGINWDDLSRKYRSFFEEADQRGDRQLYYDTLSEVIWSIPDGHVNVSPFVYFRDRFFRAFGNGIGLVIRETDDGRVFAVYVLPDSPAERAGIRVGSEILEINGRAATDHVSRVDPMLITSSTPHNRRLAQLQFATRFGTDVSSVPIRFVNEVGAIVTEQVATSSETETLFADPYAVERTGYELPVEYRLLDEGLMYATITDFLDNDALTVQLWERLIRELNENGIPGLIIDMRANGGGNGFIADQLTAYFFNEPLIVGKRGYYNEDLGEFFFDPRSDQRLYLPAEDLRYNGQVVVLVGPDCASACERFAYNLTINGRAEVIGFYPTAGLGGSVNDFQMPEGVTVRFTAGRSTDVNGKIHIEGIGVAPTIRVPVNQDTLFAPEDVVLSRAVAYLSGETELEFVNGGLIGLGQTVNGSIAVQSRVYYVFAPSTDLTVDIVVSDPTGTLPLGLAVFTLDDGALVDYSEGQDSLNQANAALRGLRLQANVNYVIEISTSLDRSTGDYTLSITAP